MSLQRKAERWLAAHTFSLSLSLSLFPFSSIPSTPRPYARNPMASGAGGDWTHLGDCGTHRPPLCTPLHSLSFSLPPSLLSFRPPRHPFYTAVNRVYPLAVAQPFNQTDWNIPWIQKKRTAIPSLSSLQPPRYLSESHRARYPLYPSVYPLGPRGYIRRSLFDEAVAADAAAARRRHPMVFRDNRLVSIPTVVWL